MPAGQALNRLMEGNLRWVQGNLAHPNRSAERREELAGGQSPFATVFSCIDSRVPPEIVFDCGLGDLAVVRSGGHVLDESAVMASLQFSAAQLGTPLLMVLGHQACGAVRAAIQAIDQGQDLPGSLGVIVEALRPAHAQASAADEAGDLVQRTVQTHTRLTVQRLTGAPLMAPLVEGGELRVVGAYYSLDSGTVTLLD